MAVKQLWTLPVPSTSLVDGGPRLAVRRGREVAIQFGYEEDDGRRRGEALVLQGVESYRCTYYHARDASMAEAYDCLIDRGVTAWLADVVANLRLRGQDTSGLAHLMIDFDDGPCFEFLCRGFRVEET